MTMLTAPEAAKILVVSLLNTVEAIRRPAIEKRIMAVKSLGSFGIFRSEILPMKPSQKNTLMSLFIKKADESQAPICMP